MRHASTALLTTLLGALVAGFVGVAVALHHAHATTSPATHEVAPC